MKKLNILYNLLKTKSMLPYFVSNLSHIHYLSGFTGTTAFILIDDNGFSFITDGRYKNQIEKEILPSFNKIIVENYNLYFESLAENCSKIFVDNKTALELYVKLKKNSDVVVDIEDIIGQLRQIKNENEVKVIKNAYKIAAQALLKSLDEFSYGKTENYWASQLEFNMRIEGSKKPSFDTIIASGYRAGLPHGVASDKIVDKSEPVIVDYGAFINYCSDITRMIYSGQDSEILNIIEIVNSAKNMAIDLIKPGKLAKEVDSVARNYIEDKGYGKNFNHGLGHGVGIDVHEKPSLNPYDETVLRPGMVVTIEPGIYFDNKFGVRIEDTVLITENGCEILSSMLDKHFYKII